MSFKQFSSPSEYRHFVTIQVPETVKVNGVSTTTWRTYAANVKASIKTMRTFERANAQSVWPGAEVKIRFSFLPGVKGNMRVLDAEGTIYTIIGAPNDVDMMHREIELICKV